MKRYWPLLTVFLTGCSTFSGLFSASPQPSPGPQECEGDQCAPKSSPWRIYDKPVSVTATNVTFSSGPDALNGRIIRPQDGEDKLPGVLIIHDAGPMGRDGIVKTSFAQELPVEIPIYLSLGEQLASAGFIVLTYDKRTCVEGGAPWCTYPPSYLEAARANLAQTLTDDAHAALAFLAARSDVDATKLVVVGHGQGAALALNLPAQPRVAAKVLLTMSAYGPDDVITHQTEASIAMLTDTLKSLSSSAETDEMHARKAELELALKVQNQGFSKIRSGNEENFLGLNAAVWRSLFSIHERAIEAIKKPGQPTLVVLGEDDIEYPADNGAVLETHAGSEVKFVELSINHMLVDTEHDTGMVAAEVNDAILAFVLSKAKVERP